MAATLREALPADVPELAELAARFYAEEGFGTSAEELRRNAEVLVVDPTVHTVLALDEAGHPVGFAMTWLLFGLEQGRYVELGDLYLQPAARGTGAGRALVEDALAWGARNGAGSAYLHVDDEGARRHGLPAFYSHLGFTDAGRRVWRQELPGAGR
ncbi:GNAT family N-acetyltransferase [Motilibacter aurantiacus]|uniref:GNAT family N-acetyltransferase n=1 Tax=Motilibacter aurantiacus TaxID=2714955 RepID=UPI00140CD43F|nr:GNAT family N-acetyltransferase [Motilibacter aurantiacus]NHC46493.1 GNAT family N-acetyltransferase [Motilibacter aurantiacus]